MCPFDFKNYIIVWCVGNQGAGLPLLICLVFFDLESKHAFQNKKRRSSVWITESSLPLTPHTAWRLHGYPPAPDVRIHHAVVG